MSSMSKDQAAERIRKLLNLANGDGASEGEVENAMRFAKKLMDEYDLAEAEVFLNETLFETFRS